jgi:hypothetical protein
MSAAAESAVCAWVNSRPIVGDGNPLSRGAYLRDQASPADGAYAVIARTPEGVTPFGVAEEDSLTLARIQAQVFAGDEDTAERAAAALRSEFEKLTGKPEPCGDTGVTVLVTDNRNGPFFVPGTAEAYCFQVGADFLLTG